MATTDYGNCRICGRPLDEQDEVIPVYAREDDTVPSGYIHSDVDCSE